MNNKVLVLAFVCLFSNAYGSRNNPKNRVGNRRGLKKSKRKYFGHAVKTAPLSGQVEKACCGVGVLIVGILSTPLVVNAIRGYLENSD